MSIVKSLKRAIKQEMVAEMQVNPWLIASEQTGLDIDHVETRTLALELSDQHASSMRASAFIFGDTYESQPIDEAKKLMLDEGYEMFSSSEEGILYLHGSLGITARVKEFEGKLDSILLLCDFEIDQNQLTPTSLTGLGAQGEIINNRFNCSVDATFGLSTKMFVLRHFATDGESLVQNKKAS